MTTVLASGDSFVWGSELADSPHGGPGGYSANTFAALLATDVYICAAYPGNSNQDIARSIKLCLKEFGSVDAVIVCWTWPSRDNTADSDNVILDIEQLLQSHNIPYLFTCADNCVVTGKLDYSNWFFFPPAPVEELYNTHKPRGFYQWARENKYKCGAENHPLEEAHRDAAELMKDRFNDLVKKTVQ